MIALIDYRADSALLSSLMECGFEPILMPPADYLQPAVASHTDMLLFIGFGRLFCHARYYECNKELIDCIAKHSDLELIISNEPTGSNYPKDVLFNACVVGNKFICNTKSVSRLILKAAVECGYQTVNVPQGYAKCSVCIVSDNAIVTADTAIANACTDVGMDVLNITEGHVSLPPYDYGFIGGASGLCDNNVYFCGLLDTHPDFDRIISFCASHGKSVVSLSKNVLQDVGTVFFI